jgi:hypothetical protein
LTPFDGIPRIDIEKINNLDFERAINVLCNSSAHFAQFPQNERRTVVTQKLNEAIQKGQLAKNNGKIYWARNK